MNHLIQPTGFFKFSWVLPAIIAVAILGAVLIPFLRQLTARERLWFFSSQSSNYARRDARTCRNKHVTLLVKQMRGVRVIGM